MTKPTLGFSITLVAFALTIVFGCNALSSTDKPTAPNVELRAYSVPKGYEQELRSTVRSVLDGVGRAEIGPAGQLIVTAPAKVHTGIEALIRQLEKQPLPPPPTPVTLTYWIVAGRPKAAAQAAGGASRLPVHQADGYTVTGYDALSDAAPALREIAASVGPTDFVLIERLRLTSIGDERARAAGGRAMVEQRAAALADAVVAEVQINFPGRQYSLQTEARIGHGQFLVLGQSGYRDDLGLELNGASLYYVIASDAR